MTRPEVRALLVSVGLHGMALWGLALAPPWEAPEAAIRAGAWSRPVVIAGYEPGGGSKAETRPETEPERQPERQPERAPRKRLIPSVPPDPEPPVPDPEAISFPDAGSPAESEPEVGVSSPLPVPGEGAGEAGRAETGGVDRPPRFLGFSLPKDREGAREVQVRILVGPGGRVLDVTGAEGQTLDAQLLEEIRRAAETMRFLPAMKSGRPVAAWMRMGFVL